MRTVPLSEAHTLPPWRRPIALLFLMAMAMPVAFATWSALLNNWVIAAAGFNGADIGLLHTVREIPGLLAVGLLAVLLVLREQALAVAMLILLGLATAVTAQFPTLGGILVVTLFSSIGFHYFEAMHQSLSLQWLDKLRAPQMLGWIISAGSAATLVVYLCIVLTWERLGLTYGQVYGLAGGFTVLVALVCLLAYPRFEGPVRQSRRIVLRRRYGLYYALQFMAGARRQILVVFAGFMLVERFGWQVHQITALFMVTLVVSILTAPLIGRMVAVWGERRVMIVQYSGLIGVFAAYAGIYWFDWSGTVAAVLYVLDHMFFAMSLSLKTYFQKIADPADISPTAAVAFTINHIPAVFLPVALGLVWLASPAAVFALAAVLAGVSLALALMVPRHPVPGHETVFAPPVAAPAE